MNRIKIVGVMESVLRFSDDSCIRSHHEQDCCEYNWADFEAIDDLAKEWEFTLPLTFKKASGYGFRFGNPPDKMVFVPCYSHQNGYYSSDVDIYYQGRRVLKNVEGALDE